MNEMIWSLEMEYFTALYSGDHDQVLALTHPAFLGWPDGLDCPLDRQGSADYMRRFSAGPCELYIERGGIQIQGGVALTQYTLNAGQVRSRICHTWVDMDGQWKLRGGMSSKL